MSKTRITNEVAEHWSEIAQRLREASRLVGEAQVILMTKLGHVRGNAFDKLNACEEALSGQAYMFTPQSEWLGGDISDPKNFAFRRPHVHTEVPDESPGTGKCDCGAITTYFGPCPYKSEVEGDCAEGWICSMCYENRQQDV